MECTGYSVSHWQNTDEQVPSHNYESTNLSLDFHQPLHREEELANAISHGLAALATLIATVVLLLSLRDHSWMTIGCCLVFGLSCFSVFTASALSHFWLEDQSLLKRLRAWDQGLIYTMIAGTYSPLVWTYADQSIRIPLLIGMWIAAITGFVSKVIVKHRVNSIGLTTYLILGWAPAFWLFTKVPSGLLFWMFAGCSGYLVGVCCLVNDRRVKYLHVLWHVCVMFAATMHFLGVYFYVAISGS